MLHVQHTKWKIPVNILRKLCAVCKYMYFFMNILTEANLKNLNANWNLVFSLESWVSTKSVKNYYYCEFTCPTQIRVGTFSGNFIWSFQT